MNFLDLESKRSFVSYQKAILKWCEDDPRSILEIEIHRSRGKHLSKRKEFVLTNEEKDVVTKIGLIKIRNDFINYVDKRLTKPASLEKYISCDNHPIIPSKFGTGLCCRKCMGEYYKVDEWAILSDEQKERFVSVLMKWLLQQIN